MKFTINRWGVGLEIGALIINLFIGDLYIKIPRVGECAFNSSGFYLDPWKAPEKGVKEAE